MSGGVKMAWAGAGQSKFKGEALPAIVAFMLSVCITYKVCLPQERGSLTNEMYFAIYKKRIQRGKKFLAAGGGKKQIMISAEKAGDACKQSGKRFCG